MVVWIELVALCGLFWGGCWLGTGGVGLSNLFYQYFARFAGTFRC